jgi:hypothetical protein
VSGLLEEENPSWIPRMRALCLGDGDEDNEEEQASEEMQKHLEAWKNRLQNIKKALDDVELNLQKIEKLKEEEKAL